jgi:hypothetical protein
MATHLSEELQCAPEDPFYLQSVFHIPHNQMASVVHGHISDDEPDEP